MQKINETAEHRIVGLTIETRPDVCTTKHIDEILEFVLQELNLVFKTQMMKFIR